jgi:hypothetical protein
MGVNKRKAKYRNEVAKIVSMRLLAPDTREGNCKINGTLLQFVIYPRLKHEKRAANAGCPFRDSRWKTPIGS